LGACGCPDRSGNVLHNWYNNSVSVRNNRNTLSNGDKEQYSQIQMMIAVVIVTLVHAVMLMKMNNIHHQLSMGEGNEIREAKWLRSLRGFPNSM
jgi:hypothetical protein